MRKSIFIILLNFVCIVCYAQKPQLKTTIEEEKIGTKLLDNFNGDGLKDSIALYTFAVKIEVKKTKLKTTVKKIETNDPLLSEKIFPKLDSLLLDIDFGVFIKSEGTRYIIIPVAITIDDYNGAVYPTKIDTRSVYDSFGKLFFYQKGKFKYDYIFLAPKSLLMSKKVSW